MTLQTDSPLVPFPGTPTTRSTDWFAKSLAGDFTEWDIDQPYQRGHVWGTRRRQLLIKSVMTGVAIGAIIVNDRFSAGFYEPAYCPAGRHANRNGGPNRNWAYAIIDGKQRVTSLVMWATDRLTAPASWFPPEDVIQTEDTDDGPYVRLNGLSARQRRIFGNWPIAVIECRLTSLAAEAEVFALINGAGLAQGDVDPDVTAPDLGLPA